MICENCGADLTSDVKFCSGCGTPQNRQPPHAGGVGYSPVADTPEFRRFAAMKKRKESRKSIGFMAIICVAFVLYMVAVWGFGDSLGFTGGDKLPISALGIGAAFLAVFFSLKRIVSSNRPPVEMVVMKYDSNWEGNISDAGASPTGNQSLNVIFKGAEGRAVSFGAPDRRVQEYYQIGDRCLYHRDIGFFEKHDKSRDTFALCPFCTMKVEIGQTRCTHCNKPMLV